MRCRLASVADFGLYEFVVSNGEVFEWFVLGPDEAHALRGLIDELGPDLEVVTFADVCGLVRSVTGAPPEGDLGWPPPLLA